MDISAISSLTAGAQNVISPNELTPAQRYHAAHLKGAALRNANPAEQRAAVASQFEAIFVRQLLGKTMTSMLGSGGGAMAGVYGDLMTDAFAQQLTAGSGLGLARLLEKQLTPRQPANPAPTQPAA
jgi:Rod binding domain-containing protein